jgi:Nif-specific regulatory protein
MSPEVQAKFLRVLEGQPFERVGGGEPISVDVRVVTATNRDLEQAVRERQLRRDLFFRLQVLEIRVPALREHAEDISAIANHFLVRFASQTHRRVKGFTPTALQKLQQHSWPGNVRELRNVVERAVILSDHELLLPDDIALTNLNLDAPGTAADESQNLPAREPVGAPLPAAPASPEQLWTNLIQQETSLDEMDRLYIEAVLKSTMWNKSRASRMLQIERTTLDRRLKKYGLNRPAGIPADEDGATEVENII